MNPEPEIHETARRLIGALDVPYLKEWAAKTLEAGVSRELLDWIGP